MEDTVKIREYAYEIAALLDEHKGQDTVALYIGDKSSFTDYFVITTIMSSGHLRGMLKYIRAYLDEHNLEPVKKHKKIDDDGWVLVDCGVIIIHLMTSELRKFYDLEKLWYSGEHIFQSSKSS